MLKTAVTFTLFVVQWTLNGNICIQVRVTPPCDINIIQWNSTEMLGLFIFYSKHWNSLFKFGAKLNFCSLYFVKAIQWGRKWHFDLMVSLFSWCGGVCMTHESTTYSTRKWKWSIKEGNFNGLSSENEFTLRTCLHCQRDFIHIRKATIIKCVERSSHIFFSNIFEDEEEEIVAERERSQQK